MGVTSVICLVATAATGVVAPLWSVLVGAVSLIVIAAVCIVVNRPVRSEWP
jgi:hypothetical protein